MRALGNFVRQTVLGSILGLIAASMITMPAIAAQRLRGSVIIDNLTYGPAAMTVPCGTVATTGNTDCYAIAPETGHLTAAIFYGSAALARNDTNYITFSITNLGQDGLLAASMLTTSPAGTNTTKSTGGVAIVKDAAHALTLAGNAFLAVQQGDRLLLRAAAANTLNNTVTYATFFLKFAPIAYPTATPTKTPTP